MPQYEPTGKRIIDILAAAGTLVLLSPLMLLATFAVLVEDGRPVLFRQRRVGESGKEFYLLKFRSMPANTPNVPSADAAKLRVTRVGRVLRRTNFDELPQLMNILRGEMSIVGPRPALPTQVDLLRLREENGAMERRPGLTGLAQVRAFDGMTVEQKAAFDGEYARHVTLVGDSRIILNTVLYLLRPPPVY